LVLTATPTGGYYATFISLELVGADDTRRCGDSLRRLHLLLAGHHTHRPRFGIWSVCAHRRGFPYRIRPPWRTRARPVVGTSARRDCKYRGRPGYFLVA